MCKYSNSFLTDHNCKYINIGHEGLGEPKEISIVLLLVLLHKGEQLSSLEKIYFIVSTIL